MKLNLELIQEVKATKKAEILKLEGEMFIIGRENADIIVPHPLCSRSHAKIYENSEHLLCLEDLGSKNGTFLGEEKVERVILKIGDSIRIGSFELVVKDFKSNWVEKDNDLFKIEKEGDKLFKAMPESERKKFSNFIEKEEDKPVSQLNEILKRLKQNQSG